MNYVVKTENKVKILELNKATTYNGFKGYFTLSNDLNEIDLVGSGVTTDETDRGHLFITEYYDIDTGDPIYFATTSDIYAIDFMEPIDYGPGRCSVSVKVKGK